MRINNNDIYIVRGDTGTIIVSITDMTNNLPVPVPLVAGDTVYLTVKTNINTEIKMFQKVVTTFTNGNAIINIESSDTKPLSYGQYVYDIQLSREDGTVITIIGPSMFKIEGEVTYE